MTNRRLIGRNHRLIVTNLPEFVTLLMLGLRTLSICNDCGCDGIREKKKPGKGHALDRVAREEQRPNWQNMSGKKKTPKLCSRTFFHIVSWFTTAQYHAPQKQYLPEKILPELFLKLPLPDLSFSELISKIARCPRGKWYINFGHSHYPRKITPNRQNVVDS